VILHALERTSPKGEKFLGFCTKCGREDLPIAAMNEECVNPANLTDGDAIMIAVGETLRKDA